MSAVRLILAILFSSTLGSKLIIGVDTYLGFTKVVVFVEKIGIMQIRADARALEVCAQKQELQPSEKSALLILCAYVRCLTLTIFVFLIIICAYASGALRPEGGGGGHGAAAFVFNDTVEGPQVPAMQAQGIVRRMETGGERSFKAKAVKEVEAVKEVDADRDRRICSRSV
jgi:hypothetical protein